MNDYSSRFSLPLSLPLFLSIALHTSMNMRLRVQVMSVAWVASVQLLTIGHPGSALGLNSRGWELQLDHPTATWSVTNSNWLLNPQKLFFRIRSILPAMLTNEI